MKLSGKYNKKTTIIFENFRQPSRRIDLTWKKKN